MKYDAFISYRRGNGFFMAQVVRDHLEKQKVRCFLDVEELRSGKFDNKILEAICIGLIKYTNEYYNKVFNNCNRAAV